MLQKCKVALLISEVESFRDSYKKLASDVNIKLNVSSQWDEHYRVSEDVVILGGKYLGFLNPSYYSKAVVILKPAESPAPYIQQGVSRFIFDYQNQYELITALFYEKPVVVHADSKEVKEIVEEYRFPCFKNGDYDFRFDKDVYLYKGKPIYLCASQKRFLAQWLIGGHKENKRRMTLCNLRKKFGEDFLKDIDRFGNYKEACNEQ